MEGLAAFVTTAVGHLERLFAVMRDGGEGQVSIERVLEGISESFGAP